jgi:hypothetical protein
MAGLTPSRPNDLPVFGARSAVLEGMSECTLAQIRAWFSTEGFRGPTSGDQVRLPDLPP